MHKLKLKGIQFETAIIERYRRRETSIEEALDRDVPSRCFVRRVEDITEALCGTRVSSGTISNLNQKAYENIEKWRCRPVTGKYAYVYLPYGYSENEQYDILYLMHGGGGFPTSKTI